MGGVVVSPVQETAVRPAKSFLTLQHKWAIGLSLALFLATVAVYASVVHDPFANIDDQGYVYENLHVQAGLTWPTVKWALTTIDDSNWHPVTWLSHALDCQIYGIDPGGHHITNVLLHAIDAVILLWVLLQATGFLGRSFMVAALFALHPINVESVAWVAERKTVLSTLFFLLAIGAYTWYARRPRKRRYAVVAVLFILGLMAKPQIITLPCLLLLWDYWPLRRMFAASDPLLRGSALPPAFPPKSLSWLLKEKIPLLVICAASALVTLKAQHAGHPQSWPYSVWIRVGNSIVAYARYLGKAFWPSHLALMYLHPGKSLKLWHVAAAACLLLAITAVVIVKRRYRYLPVGWFWFLGVLVPTIGLIQVGRQAMADRYAYNSFLGIFIIVCWGAADWASEKHWPRLVLPAASIAALLALTVITYRQVGYWRDNLTLWSHTIQVTKDNWMAEDMVAGALLTQGHREEAIAHYRVAAAVNPSDPASNVFLGIYEQQRGNLEGALQHYKTSLVEIGDPLEQAKVYQNMAVAYRDMGNIDKSVECLRKAKKLRGR